jgi:hypothetical protein
VKKSKHEDIDRDSARILAELSPELLKAVVARPSETKRRARRHKDGDNQKQNSLTEKIYEELEQPGLACAEARKPLNNLVLEPIAKLAWTKEVQGYDAARLSAEKAMQRIYAGTKQARAGLEGDPWLDVCLYKVGAGLLRHDNPEILRSIQHAQKIGKGQWFIEKLAAAFKNAAKRVPGASEFSRLRASLARYWLYNLFWLMPDALIARLAHVSREAIRKAISELKLVKHAGTARGAPVVKGLAGDGRFIFREGYPARN